MSIAEQLNRSADGLEAMLRYANTATGSNDTDIGEAILKLVNGFGGGGGNVKIDTGTFKLDASTPSYSSSNRAFVPHNLGDKPDAIIVWSEDFSGIGSPAGGSSDLMGFIWFRNLIPQKINLSSSAASYSSISSMIIALLYEPTYNMAWIRVPTSTADYYASTYLTESVFPLYGYSKNNYYRSEVTYKYIVFKKFW